MRYLFIAIGMAFQFFVLLFAFAYGSFLSLSASQFQKLQIKDHPWVKQLEDWYFHHYESTVVLLLIVIFLSTAFGMCSFHVGLSSLMTLSLPLVWAIVLMVAVFSVNIPLFVAPFVLQRWPLFASRLVFRAITIARKVNLPLQRLFVKRYDVLPQQEDVLGEIDEILESAKEEGQLESGEYRLLHNVLMLKDVLVADIMTPRTVVFALPAQMTVEKAIQQPGLQQFSRIPITEKKDLDSTIGYVMTREILWSFVQGKKDLPLKMLKREIHTVPETMPLDVALEEFLRRREQLFLVADEFGGIEGLVTLEDIVEAILGAEIVDEVDQVIDLREVAKRRKQEKLERLHQMAQRLSLPHSGKES